MKAQARVFAAGSLALALGLGMSTAASASGDSITVSNAHAFARGALVTVTVTVTCTPQTDSQGVVHNQVDGWAALSQSVRHGQITSASGYFPTLTCNDQPQTAQVTITPGTLAFRKGTAVVTALAFDNSLNGFLIPNFGEGPTVIKIS